MLLISIFFAALRRLRHTHDLVKVPGVEPEQACTLLEEAGYDPGGCWSIMDTDQMRQALIQFQEHQRLKPADGDLNRETWARLNTVVRAMRKLKAARAAPPKASPAARLDPTKAPLEKRAASPPPPPLPIEAGARVFAVERAKCLPRSGAWVLAYVGVVQSLEGGKVLVTLQGRISYRFNPGEKGGGLQGLVLRAPAAALLQFGSLRRLGGCPPPRRNGRL